MLYDPNSFEMSKVVEIRNRVQRWLPSARRMWERELVFDQFQFCKMKMFQSSVVQQCDQT